MKKQSIKDYYFVIQGWMLEELNLNGCELSVFAIIYGFSQGMNTCDISLNYLSRLTGYSKMGIMKAIDKLVEKEYILKINNTSLLSNKKQRNSYQVLVLPGSKLSIPSSSKLSLPLTVIIDNLKNNLKINKYTKSQIRELKEHILQELKDYEEEKQEIAHAKWLD